MNENNAVSVLRDQVLKTLSVLDEIMDFYGTVKREDIPRLGRNQASATLLAEVFTSFYTCCETAFVRISKFFENNLDRDNWHRDLLDRMTLRIQGVRPRVLSDETKLILDEFRRFRHFKRYYFQFKYDWVRIEYLEIQLDRAYTAVKNELARFMKELETLG